ncbi:carbohydrate ABC transporter permease [Paenibacillus sp. IB182496]|uniref:Carbohydrate ABC transporter permease n=1 Tax=Paenibacillus sabuli TaxID=2772509 RepID=A0A927GTP6_9BACL|nr:carbohydrate ABC transporter permease [Paenibacillus sabuli]MBD2847516.1 carbohydrate ABC transporter permease [Paenibacillus sabuli]
MAMTTGEKWFQGFAVVLSASLSLAMIYPFIHMISISLSTPAEALRPGIHLYPRELTLDAYQKALTSNGMWYGFQNTIFRTVVGTFLSLVFMSMAAYPLSKKDLPDRNFFMMFIIMTMFFSGGLIPTYLLVKNLGLFDSRWVYVIPVLFNTFSLIILRNFFMEIPSELEDSAKIDGANDIRTLFSIVIPLSKPILATVGLWSAVMHWNAWFDALIYVQDQSKVVLQVFIRRLIVENQDLEIMKMMDDQKSLNAETVKAAVLMVATLPILLLYPFLQKYFIQGILVGSLKG